MTLLHEVMLRKCSLTWLSLGWQRAPLSPTAGPVLVLPGLGWGACFCPWAASEPRTGGSLVVVCHYSSLTPGKLGASRLVLARTLHGSAKSLLQVK